MAEYIVKVDETENGEQFHIVDWESEIVRCRDCRYCDSESKYCFNVQDVSPAEIELDGYCAWGECDK